MNWMRVVVEWPLWLNIGGVILVALLLAWRLVRRVRRWAPYPTFKENNELVGFTYAVFGLIYGVLLAFTIIVAWERYEEAERITHQEVTILSELWRDAQAFPAATRLPVQTALKDYGRSVIVDEWPTMAAHGQASPRTMAIYESLWRHSYLLAPTTANQTAYLSEYLARLNELSATRRLRLLASHGELHGLLWLVLLLGAIPTIGYTLLFANRHDWVQVAITASIALIVLLSLLLVMQLQYPFSGDAALRPEAYQELLTAFQQRATLP